MALSSLHVLALPEAFIAASRMHRVSLLQVKAAMHSSLRQFSGPHAVARSFLKSSSAILNDPESPLTAT